MAIAIMKALIMMRGAEHSVSTQVSVKKQSSWKEPGLLIVVLSKCSIVVTNIWPGPYTPMKE